MTSAHEATAGRGAAARTRDDEPGRGPIELAYLALASQRTTSLLVIVLAVLVGFGAVIPQGKDALVLAEHPDAESIHALIRWGLTDVFASEWVKAVGALLAVNLVAVVLAALRAPAEAGMRAMPEDTPFRADLTASLPERAVEALRETFRARLGAPVAEEVRGSRVTMLFATNQGGRLAPILAHLGLIMLIVGAGLAARPLPESKSVIRAWLDVKDSSSGYVGTFDMVSGEPFQFFRWASKYTIRAYVPSKDGLGPAIRMEKRQEGDRSRSEDFWIFLNAPPGFDERHRKGEVSIVARKMGFAPVPGAGVTSSSTSAALLVFGFGLLLAGVLFSRRADGRLWLDVDGDRVTVAGAAKDATEAGFGPSFDRFVAVARLAISED